MGSYLVLINCENNSNVGLICEHENFPMLLKLQNYFVNILTLIYININIFISSLEICFDLDYVNLTMKTRN